MNDFCKHTICICNSQTYKFHTIRAQLPRWEVYTCNHLIDLFFTSADFGGNIKQIDGHFSAENILHSSLTPLPLKAII